MLELLPLCAADVLRGLVATPFWKQRQPPWLRLFQAALLGGQRPSGPYFWRAQGPLARELPHPQKPALFPGCRLQLLSALRVFYRKHTLMN